MFGTRHKCIFILEYSLYVREDIIKTEWSFLNEIQRGVMPAFVHLANIFLNIPLVCPPIFYGRLKCSINGDDSECFHSSCP